MDLLQKNPFVEFAQEFCFFQHSAPKLKNPGMESEEMCANKKKRKIVGKRQKSTKSR